MDAAKKDRPQERWMELDGATWEAAKHLVKLSMSSEKLREILLDYEQRYSDNEFVLGFINERYYAVSKW